VASFVIRTLGELGEEVSFAPERQRASALGARGGVALGDLVVLRNERLTTLDAKDALVLDTTHTKDGLLDLASAMRSRVPPLSAKKGALAGDVLVSRLRPYLRQIAFVHPVALRASGRARLACSTEYYVLAPRDAAQDRLEYLVPFLLGAHAQAVLAAGQEGGHHPRVPLETLLALRVPRALVRARMSTSAKVGEALGAVYRALRALHGLIAATPRPATATAHRLHMPRPPQ
jgi:hypothetical protein